MNTAVNFKIKPSLCLALSLAGTVPLLGINANLVLAQSASILTTGLPKGAQRLNDSDLPEKLGRFFKAEAAERKLPQNGDAAAAIWLWKGDNYKTGRATFWRAAFQKSLQDGGYSYQDIDSHSISTNIYEQQYGLNSYEDAPNQLLEVETGSSPSYFVATHTESGRTYLGFWLDQPKARQCALALSQVGTRAPATTANLPVVAGATLVKDPFDVMKGVPMPKTPLFPTIARKPGCVRGWVKDMSGKPLPGATIGVQSSAVGGFRTSVTARSNAQGLYEVLLPMGVCKVIEADFRVTYNGQDYLLPLHVVDGERDTFSSQKGHVENFVLRTWGVADPAWLAQFPKSGESYYGASMRVQWFQDGLPETGTVEVTLKPKGNLLDGKPGRAFVVRWPIGGVSILSDNTINDIPIGHYTMKAQVLDDGDVLPLRIRKTSSSDPPVESFNVNFKSESNSYASLERSGIARFDVMLEP